jgi:protein-tyrosine phosphatase
VRQDREDEHVGWIELDGAVNVRDVGGLPTEDGRQVLTGRLLRSDNLQDLSAADVRRLVADLGVTTVVDLRSPHEIAAEGPGPLTRVGSVRHARHSVLPELGTATDAAATDAAAADMFAAEVAAAALATTRREGAVSRYPGDLRCGYYLGYLEDRPDQVVAALRGVATAPGAALVNCAAGKDRTGVLVALALRVAGVRPDAVVADYAASAERMPAVLDRLRASPTYAGDINSRSQASNADDFPRAETMVAFLEQVDLRYGGALAWLSDHGFGADDVRMLRDKLLEE